MTILRWDPEGTENYTIFTGVVIIDPAHNRQDETVNAWVVATSPNAEAVTAILPRCTLPEVLQARTGKKEGLL